MRASTTWWTRSLLVVLLAAQQMWLTASDLTFTRVTSGDFPTTPGSTWGCAWGDYDGDGYADLLVVNGALDLVSYLYRNNRDGTFSKVVADNPIVLDEVDGSGGVWADYDNDGDLDLFVTAWALPNAFFVNQGSGAFVRITEGRIATDTDSSVGCSWGDYDGDGWLDLIVGNGANQANALYHSRKDGTFERVLTSPIVEETLNSQGVIWGDCNNDGLPDLFVSNWEAPDSLFIKEASKQFHKVTNADPALLSLRTAWCAWGDYDNDGWLDLYVGAGNASTEPSVLYHNTGHGSFEVVTGLPSAFGAPAWGDYDNDGYLDLMVVASGRQGYLFHNNRDGTFERISESPGDAAGAGQSCAWADYDNDGFLDLFVGIGANQSQTDALYHNEGNGNAWIQVRPVGTASNRSAIGAKVRIKARVWGTTTWQMREICTGDGFTGQSDLRAHFGLGDATTIDALRIEWPSGIVQELTNVEMNQILTVIEPPRLSLLTPERLAIQSWKGQSFDVQASTDLAEWWDLKTVTNQTGSLVFDYPDGLRHHESRYYRVVAK